MSSSQHPSTEGSPAHGVSRRRLIGGGAVAAPWRCSRRQVLVRRRARFVWSSFALAGTGLGTGDGSTIPAGDAFGSLDGLAFDPDGRLWIETDGGQPIACNNQMLAADPLSGDIRRFLVGPKGCAITGWTMTPDQRTMFVNIQHPGEAATDPANPASQSSWPDGRGRLRSATLAIRRDDGKVIGAGPARPLPVEPVRPGRVRCSVPLYG